MTIDILDWLRDVVRPLRQSFGSVFEIGALNVNGSPREILQDLANEWVGCDRVPGRCVDEVGLASNVIQGRVFDTVIACECFEHDKKFWETNIAARRSIRCGGIYIVTSPTIGFPFHDYGGDFYRFTEMAFSSVFFEEMAIVDVRTVGVSTNKCVVGCAISLF